LFLPFFVSVGGVVSPSFVGYGEFLFLWLRQKVLLVWSGWGSGWFWCRRRSVVWPVFYCFFSDVLMPDLRLFADFCSTRALWPSSLSSSDPAAGCIGHAGRRSSERSLHEPKRFLLFGARDGHAPPFSRLARGGGGLRRLFLGWVVLGSARFSHAPPVLAKPACLFCQLWVEVFVGVFCYSLPM